MHFKIVGLCESNGAVADMGFASIVVQYGLQKGLRSCAQDIYI